MTFAHRRWALLGMAFVLLAAVLTLVPPVSAPPGDGIDRIVIQRDPGPNGTWVGNGTYYISDSDVFWLVGYNTSTGWVGPVAGYWWSDNPNSGDVQPRSNVTSTNFTAGPLPGVVRVSASCQRGPIGCNPGGNQTSLFNTTGPLTVLRNPVADIRIRDAPKGAGDLVLSATYYVGDSDAFWAASYDANGTYSGDVLADWSSDQTSVCGASSPGTSTTFRALAPGNCTVSATYDTGNGTVSNATGTFTVLQRPTVYVDDDGLCGGNTPCYPTFQEAMVNASDGHTVIAYPGVYPEHIVVDKRVRILGIDRAAVQVIGGGSGVAVLVLEDFVEISNLTISNAQYGLFADRVNNTRLTYLNVEDYEYGLYFNRTREAFTAWNVVTRGRYGIVTDHASNDAVRYNVISYNTAYGAKDFDSTLRNCFNWNTFHHNKVAYWYDPDVAIAPFEFDGNLIEDNEVGVLVENGPALRVTNNIFRRNARALHVVGSDLNVSANTFEANALAVRLDDADGNITANVLVGNGENLACARSASRIQGNTITGGSSGIVCSGFSGLILENTLATDGLAAIVLEGGGPSVVRDNVARERFLRFTQSAVSDLAVSDSVVLAYDSSLGSVSLGGSARVLEHRTLTIRVVDEANASVEGARVEIRDRLGIVTVDALTDPEGRLAPRSLLVRTRGVGSDFTHTPYAVRATIGSRSAEVSVSLESPQMVTLTVRAVVRPGGGVPWTIPWGLILFGSIIAMSAATLLGFEPLKYAVLALAVPLFTRIRRDNVFDDYTRGRVFQYLEMSPGDHFHGICRALGLGAGTVTYHLEVLSRLGLVTSRTDGVYKRFYPMGVRPPERNGGVLSEVQLRIVHAIRDLPGVSQKELVALLGVRQSTLYYQITQLAARGYVRAERRGRNVRYYVPESPR